MCVSGLNGLGSASVFVLALSLMRVVCVCVCRTLSGLGILVCSMDGTVAYLDFSQDELGDALNEDEKV